MQRDQRRFITTRTVRDGTGKPVGIHGHLIGPGKRSVMTLQRNAQINLINNLRRRAVGRFNWWPNLTNIAATNGPDEMPSRQVRRAEERAAAKVAASQSRKEARVTARNSRRERHRPLVDALPA